MRSPSISSWRVFTIIFLLVCATLQPYSAYSVSVIGKGPPSRLTVPGRTPRLPHPHHDWWSASARLASAGWIADPAQRESRPPGAPWRRPGMSTSSCWQDGHVTLGTGRTVEFVPLAGTDPRQLAECASSPPLAMNTPSGRSIAVLAKSVMACANDGGPPSEAPAERALSFSGADPNEWSGSRGEASARDAPDTIVAYARSLERLPHPIPTQSCSACTDRGTPSGRGRRLGSSRRDPPSKTVKAGSASDSCSFAGWDSYRHDHRTFL